ncbi:MAG TPA: nuclear transport factor 2 family protein [Burkholderiaceae bacterium]|jgi:ketosteroid isomerase-like protein|nr:nuclear transport factor 2 family protein [Burkholderiaceae bacterium]
MLDSALAVEEAFYEALARGDLDAVMALWSDEDDPICVHPGGPRLVGLAAIRESFEQLLQNGQGLAIRTASARSFDSGTLEVRNLIEQIVVEGQDGAELVSIVATNVYTKGRNGWQLAMHHATGVADAVEPVDAPPAHRMH